MKILATNFLKLLIIWAIAVLIIASCTNKSYAYGVQQKAVELALAGYKFSLGVQPTYSRGFFVRNISMHSHFMAKLERDIYGCAGNLVSLSANPFQFCHHHLAVIGKAPINTLGGNQHA